MKGRSRLKTRTEVNVFINLCSCNQKYKQKDFNCTAPEFFFHEYNVNHPQISDEYTFQIWDVMVVKLIVSYRTAPLCLCSRYEDEINKRNNLENDFVILKKVSALSFIQTEQAWLVNWTSPLSFLLLSSVFLSLLHSLNPKNNKTLALSAIGGDMSEKWQYLWLFFRLFYICIRGPCGSWGTVISTSIIKLLLSTVSF